MSVLVSETFGSLQGEGKLTGVPELVHPPERLQPEVHVVRYALCELEPRGRETHD